MKLELSAYRPSGRMRAGVAAFAGSEHTHQANQKLAEERVRLLLVEAVSPGGWGR